MLEDFTRTYKPNPNQDQLTNQEFLEHYESSDWTNTNKEQRYWGLKLEELKEEIENEWRTKQRRIWCYTTRR